MSSEDQFDRNNKAEIPSSSHLTLVDTRSVGRPEGSTPRVGRSELLAKMRYYMKQTPFHNFQRKEIAEFAKVTPALISYYFPEKFDLVLEASTPVVLSYSDNVSRILGMTDHAHIRIKKLIYQFLALGLCSGYTIDYFLFAIQRRNRNGEINLIAEQYAAINRFMEEVVSVPNRTTLDASFLQSSIWGQCIYLSRQPHLQSLTNDTEQSELLNKLTECVYDLLLKGILT